MNLCHLWITVGIQYFLLCPFVFSLPGFDSILHSYTVFSFEISWILPITTGMASTWLCCHWVFVTQVFTSETLTFRFSRISTQQVMVYLCLEKTPTFCHMNHTLNSTDYANKNSVDCDGNLENQLRCITSVIVLKISCENCQTQNCSFFFSSFITDIIKQKFIAGLMLDFPRPMSHAEGNVKWRQF